MEFTLEYENEKYLVITSDFTKRDKAEVIRIPYSDQEGDWVEYEIQVFKLMGNQFIKERVLELPDEVRGIIGKNIQDLTDRTFVANPYFDEVLIFFGAEVFTYQEQLVPIQCDQCERKNLYIMRNKGGENKSNYIADIIDLIKHDKNPDWPFKEKILFQYTVSNSQSKLDAIDLDNLAKTILDTFKGVIYESDNQITSFSGDKTSIKGIKAFIVAIKRLEENERPLFQNFFYSGKANAWREERERKVAQNKQTRFRQYGAIKEK